MTSNISQNLWHIEDQAPLHIKVQGIKEAYIIDPFRSLPNNKGGWETVSRDKSTLPFATYFYGGDLRGLPGVKPTPDQYSWWGPPTLAAPFVPQMDVKTLRQAPASSEDGVPLNEPAEKVFDRLEGVKQGLDTINELKRKRAEEDAELDQAGVVKKPAAGGNPLIGGGGNPPIGGGGGNPPIGGGGGNPLIGGGVNPPAVVTPAVAANPPINDGNEENNGHAAWQANADRFDNYRKAADKVSAMVNQAMIDLSVDQDDGKAVYDASTKLMNGTTGNITKFNSKWVMRLAAMFYNTPETKEVDREDPKEYQLLSNYDNFLQWLESDEKTFKNTSPDFGAYMKQFDLNEQIQILDQMSRLEQLKQRIRNDKVIDDSEIIYAGTLATSRVNWAQASINVSSFNDSGIVEDFSAAAEKKLIELDSILDTTGNTASKRISAVKRTTLLKDILPPHLDLAMIKTAPYQFIQQLAISLTLSLMKVRGDAYIITAQMNHRFAELITKSILDGDEIDERYSKPPNPV